MAKKGNLIIYVKTKHCEFYDYADPRPEVGREERIIHDIESMTWVVVPDFDTFKDEVEVGWEED